MREKLGHQEAERCITGAQCAGCRARASRLWVKNAKGVWKERHLAGEVMARSYRDCSFQLLAFKMLTDEIIPKLLWNFAKFSFNLK